MWNKVVSKGRLGAFALFLSLSGCTAFSDCKYEVEQKIRTHQAWGEFDDCKGRCFTYDYSSGWKAGFYDVATGGTGCPPVFAPKRYWKPPVFCEYDPCQRDEWYTGFQDGAAYAKCQPDHHYLHPFLPPQNCCQVQTVSCPEVVAKPVDFPIEHLRGDHQYLAPPMDHPHLDGLKEVSTAPPTEPAVPESQPTPVAPKAVEPAPVAPSSSDAYEKDPEPTASEATAPANSTLQHRLVQQYQEQLRKQANAGRESLLKRLVLNAAEPTSDSDF
jgi:hypothetical protein